MGFLDLFKPSKQQQERINEKKDFEAHLASGAEAERRKTFYNESLRQASLQGRRQAKLKYNPIKAKNPMMNMDLMGIGTPTKQKKGYDPMSAFLGTSKKTKGNKPNKEFEKLMRM